LIDSNLFLFPKILVWLKQPLAISLVEKVEKISNNPYEDVSDILEKKINKIYEFYRILDSKNK